MKKRFFTLKKAVLILLAALALSAVTVGCSGKENEKTLYKITASFDEQTMSVNGSVEVDYYNRTESVLKEVKLHLYPNAYKEGEPSPVTATEMENVFPDGISYGGIDVGNVRVNGRVVAASGGESQILSVPATVQPYGRAKIKMDFTLTLPRARHRLGYYGTSVNLGNWFPIVCVYQNGEWDDHTYYPLGDPFFSETADFSVSFTFPEGYEFASTGNANVKTGKTTADVRVKNVRDFAVCLTKNRVYSRIVDGVTLRYFGREDETSFLNTAEAALTTFGRLFGKYPYDSLCVVKTPFNTGGMEYPGLVYISDALGESLTHEVIVHEIAHQWWYAAVGNDQVREAWLDEGLTEYSTTLFYESNPEYGISKGKRLAEAMTAYMMYSDVYLGGGRGDSSMNRSLTQFTDQMNYSYLTYVKGELMFEALSNVIGEKAFISGLKKYYKAYKFKIASADDLISCFEAASKKELKGFFDSWLTGAVKMY